MQFIADGPDIPEALLEAHEEGRVIFFCGAGVSYPAGLPGFKDLVKQIYEESGTTFTEIEKSVFERDQFDLTLDLLEKRLPGQRATVRRSLAKILKPKLRRKGAIDSHIALLQLAKSREGSTKLVTTNFDRIFHTAAKRAGQKFQEYTAPMLPIPKKSKWDGVVYLHGLLPYKYDEFSLNRLVVTSGDFGLAYLTERWASRFVSELFRNYEVCFVGYSINDPVLRYMMDALAADRMQGEVTPKAWAFGDCEPGLEDQQKIEWEAKGVIPILYSVPVGSYDHSALHQTLHCWADIYRDGVQGKEAIIIKHALAQPQDSTYQDDFVGRVLWALSDKSGLPAKRFAEMTPVPSLDWLLDTFEIERFGHDDLARFGVSAELETDNKLRFSLIRRPSSYYQSQHMQLTAGGVNSNKFDDVMYHIARWLLRYLDDPRLVIWIANRGGQLHERFLWMIQDELDRYAALSYEGKNSELSEIRLQAPKAVPSPLMITLWRLLINGRYKSLGSSFDLYSWKDRLKHEGLTTTLRLELRKLLAPKIVISKPFRFIQNDSEKNNRIRQLVNIELVLSCDNARSALVGIKEQGFNEVLPNLLEEFQLLLRDALDLLNELGEADQLNDRSEWYLPSIAPHCQNRGFHEWVCLIELLRDSWLAVYVSDLHRSKRIAENWFELPYPTFKRLALFASSQDDCIKPEIWVQWLLTNNSWFLWSSETGREVYRLFVLQGRYLKGDALKLLENAILLGPPREMFVSSLENKQWDELVIRSIWLHLAKLNSSGCMLNPNAAKCLKEISDANPKWELATNESDEFSIWSTSSDDEDYDYGIEIEKIPRKRDEIVKWLSKSSLSEKRSFYEDTWRETCKTRFFHCLLALNDLKQQGLWPQERWREALHAWSDEKVILRTWKYAAPLVKEMPKDVLQKNVSAVTWWLEIASRSISSHENIMIDLVWRVLDLKLDNSLGIRKTQNGDEVIDFVSSAINHPVGQATQALLNVWIKKSPRDGSLLPNELIPIFTLICSDKTERYRLGRVILSSRLISLFRTDRFWTEKYLLPLYSWSNSTEAKAIWEGFMWSPRIYQPLLIVLKPNLLDCSKNYEALGKHRQRFSLFFTYMALEKVEGFSIDELRLAFNKLPTEGLEYAAQALTQALEGASKQSEEFWKNRVQFFWQEIWPKSRNLITPKIAESVARLCLAARGEFSSALNVTKDWLIPIDNPQYIIHRLKKSGLCTQSPSDALMLLDIIIHNKKWLSKDLANCLNEIQAASACLRKDKRFNRLEEYSRMHRL